MLSGIEGEVASLGMAGVWVPLLLLAGLLLLLARTPVGESRREERPVAVRTTTIEDVLRGRLARGEISPREFEDALRVLRDS